MTERRNWYFSFEMQSDLLPISHSMPAMASMTANCRGENRVVVSRSSSLDDDVGKPLLLPRSLTSVPNQQRRRRSASDISLTTLPSRQRSLRRDVGHAAAETYLLTRLSFKLLRYLGYLYLIFYPFELIRSSDPDCHFLFKFFDPGVSFLCLIRIGFCWFLTDLCKLNKIV